MPSSNAENLIRRTGFIPSAKTMIIFVQRKKIRKIRNCVFHEKLFAKPGKQILHESASNLGQPAN